MHAHAHTHTRLPASLPPPPLPIICNTGAAHWHFILTQQNAAASHKRSQATGLLSAQLILVSNLAAGGGGGVGAAGVGLLFACVLPEP